MSSSTFEERLRKYARLVIQAGVNVQPGQQLVLGADISQGPFVRLLLEEAYRAGALHVHTVYSDDLATLTRYEHGSAETLAYAPGWVFQSLAENVKSGAGYLRVTSSDPGLLRNVPPQKIAVASKAAASASLCLSEAIQAGASWCIAGCASPEWAKAVFPGEPEEAAVAKLWEAIFLCCHVDADDPVESWNRHVSSLEARADKLTACDFASLHFKGPGTDLTIGLAEGHVWIGGPDRTAAGTLCSPNIPTEEVFTMPHRERVDGVVSSSMPLSLRGTIVDGIEMTFKKGVVVGLKAKSGEDVMAGLLDTDEGSRRLGEVALVPNSSRVSRSGLLFFNTLYDENAACHIAMGRAYGNNLRGYESATESEKEARGQNSSLIHVDWMIGSGELDVDGIHQDGSKEPLMRSGEWV